MSCVLQTGLNESTANYLMSIDHVHTWGPLARLGAPGYDQLTLHCLSPSFGDRTQISVVTDTYLPRCSYLCQE